jgi:hypothetical protein
MPKNLSARRPNSILHHRAAMIHEWSLLDAGCKVPSRPRNSANWTEPLGH